MRRVAILGATSHIARGLIAHFMMEQKFSLHVYTRSGNILRPFLNSLGNQHPVVMNQSYHSFLETDYDVLINCIGVGTHRKLEGEYSRFFTVTEAYDNQCITYLLRSPETTYICFSSGIVGNRVLSDPVHPTDYYTLVRLNAETKHRSLGTLNIIDIRVFSYFSRWADLSDGYFITDIIKSILDKKPFTTDSKDMLRDYISPDDLFEIIKQCIQVKGINLSLEAASACPASKSQIIDYFVREHALRVRQTDEFEYTSASGAKDMYVPRHSPPSVIHYTPRLSSMDTIRIESMEWLK